MARMYRVGGPLCGAAMRDGKVCGLKAHADGATHRSAESLEGFKAARREYRQTHPEIFRKSGNKYYAENREKANAQSREYRESHPEYFREYLRQRRAESRRLPHERIDERRLFVQQEGLCGICLEPLGDKWELDHIIPVSKRGWHVYANVQLVHGTAVGNGNCNQVKRNRVDWESGQVDVVLLATIGRHPRIWNKVAALCVR